MARYPEGLEAHRRVKIGPTVEGGWLCATLAHLTFGQILAQSCRPRLEASMSGFGRVLPVSGQHSAVSYVTGCGRCCG
jgi:hypothetical protein